MSQATDNKLIDNLTSLSNTQSNTSASNNWATTISHYLLHRRQKTQSAYQAQLKSTATITTITDDEWLFNAIFSVLVQRLEEGHTVVVLDIDCKDTKQTDNSADEARSPNNSLSNSNSNSNINGNLYPWQQQLMQPLLQPLLAQFDSSFNSVGDDNEIVELLMQDHSPLWQQLSLQSTLSIYEQQIQQQSYQSCQALYNYMQQLAQNCPSSLNSLSKFINKLNQQLFFDNAKKQNSSPIVFQIDSKDLDKNTHNEGVKLTLWLHRAWQAEYTLASNIMRIKQQKVTVLPVTLNPLLNEEQQAAINMANHSAFSIITGGPGTGKTFTVAQLVIALQQAHEQSNEQSMLYDDKANLALAAPTGKAAQRMQESLKEAIQQAGIAMQLPEAKTIHRLLGIGQGGQPRYNSDNPLSEDIIIIDEASMLGVELANHLVSAIKPNARLILLGDANQLAAVDAGAVLADLCRLPALQDVSQCLTKSRRFTDDSGIGQLAKLINQQHKDMTEVWQLIAADESLNFYDLLDSDAIKLEDKANHSIENSLSNNKISKNTEVNFKGYFKKSKNILQNRSKAKSMPDSLIDDFNELLKLLNQFKILTAGHHGRCGDHYINRYLDEQHRSELKLPLSKSPWYHGRPIMVLQNNYELELFNGDIGICLQSQKGQLLVFFENKTQGIAITRFSDEMVATAYAMTIHKSQGSEFEHVAISFDDSHERLLSQELIYTAVTRAKKQISIFSTKSAFTRALNTPTIRQTGLALQFQTLDEL